MSLRRRSLPAGVHCSLPAHRSTSRPLGDQWWHEIKRDGIRVIARKQDKRRPLLASSNVTTASISAMERPTCSFSSTCIDPGARSRSLSGEQQKTTLNACASSSMSIIPMPSTSGLCRITCRPRSAGALCIRHSRPPKLGAFCDGSSSITPPSTQVGSIWLRSRSECCAANVSPDASTQGRCSNPRSLPRNISAMHQARSSNGCSQPTKHAPKWAGPAQRPLRSARTKPKSHNHCAAVLGMLGFLIALGSQRLIELCWPQKNVFQSFPYLL
jgi:hypothetical protein